MEVAKHPAGECESCPAGRHTASRIGQTNQDDCDPCGVGTYSTVLGAADASACESCPAGFFVGVQGATACGLCPAGTIHTAVAEIERLVVTWPDGTESVLDAIPTRQQIVVSQP